MPVESPAKPLLFTPDLFRYHRRKTRVVMVGSVGVGGDHPIRLQSMTTTPTTDVAATVAQSIRMIHAGCEIVRITAPTPADARALGEIRSSLDQSGFSKIPLVADIHFNPECAMEAANHVEKIRVNPGNYADAKAFKTLEYSDAEYDAELRRIEERFTPLVTKCKKLGRAMRIGCNHGSLSDRIMNRYGDSPLGMVEAALEFVRICRKNDYHEIILSMKASNPKIMIAAYRLLVARMEAEGMDYPLHLGVTEAGYGEDGRIKSAIGIGSLLNDGLGDTIRVSLTEDPEFEIPVAAALAAPYQSNGSPRSKVQSPKSGPSINDSDLGPGTLDIGLSLCHVPDFYAYSRRPTKEIRVGPFKLGGENTVRVVIDASSMAGPQILALLEAQLKSGQDMVPEILAWTVANPDDLRRMKEAVKFLARETSRLAFLGRFTDLGLAKEGLPQVNLAFFDAPRTPGVDRMGQFKEFVRAARAAKIPVLLEAPECHRGPLEPARNLLRGIETCEAEGHRDLVLSFNLPSVQAVIANVRLAAALLREKRGQAASHPFHLRFPAREFIDDLRLEASIAFGSLLCDGIGDSVQIGTPVQSPMSNVQSQTSSTLDLGPWTLDIEKRGLELLYNILQGAGVRITKTEFVSCPSCGRTLFDLQEVTERIKQKTGHLKGVKIAIMGCIVNGPGEMADADFGYVGGAPDKINLYVGKECVEKGIPFSKADDRLIALIKSHGKWVDPK